VCLCQSQTEALCLQLFGWNMLGLSKLFGRETISYLYSCVQSKNWDLKSLCLYCHKNVYDLCKLIKEKQVSVMYSLV